MVRVRQPGASPVSQCIAKQNIEDLRGCLCVLLGEFDCRDGPVTLTHSLARSLTCHYRVSE